VSAWWTAHQTMTRNWKVISKHYSCWAKWNTQEGTRAKPRLTYFISAPQPYSITRSCGILMIFSFNKFDALQMPCKRPFLGRNLATKQKFEAAFISITVFKEDTRKAVPNVFETVFFRHPIRRRSNEWLDFLLYNADFPQGIFCPTMEGPYRICIKKRFNAMVAHYRRIWKNMGVLSTARPW